MQRFFIIALAALLTFATARAEGPDDKYIEIYKLIQEADQLAASGQAPAAKLRYLNAQQDLKTLQTSYPNWNDKLVQFRLRILETKLGALPKGTAPVQETPASAPPQVQQPAPMQPAPVTPPPATPPPTRFVPTPTPEKRPTQVTTLPVPSQPDLRDQQIRTLQDQLGRLQADKSVLEAKLREALSAQPAAVDPRELARADERIRYLEKEKEVLRVSLQVVESKVSQANDAGAADARKALAQANQKLTQQGEAIAALRQEKDILERRMQEAQRAHEATVKTLSGENETLKAQLAQKPSAVEPARSGDQSEKELTSAKAALQSSRDTVASLQVRLRTLQEERDQLEKNKKDLESRLAATPAPVVNAAASESSQVKRLQKERDDLQKKLNETVRQLAENKSKTRQAQGSPTSEELSALRARLEALEARKVPYTDEELALFKKPQDAAVVAAPPIDDKPVAQEAPAALGPLLAEAQRAFTARRFDEAEKKYLEVLRIDDKNVATLQRLAAAQLEQSHPQDAEATLRRALEQNGNEPRTLLLMGIAKYDQEKFDEALAFLSRSAQADAQNAETQNYLGITLSQKGQRAAAETALRKAIQLSPSYSSAHYNLAVIYATQQPPFIELARWHYQKSIAFGHPQNAEFEKTLDQKQAQK